MTRNLKEREWLRAELRRQRQALVRRERDERAALRAEGEAATTRVLDKAEASAVDLQNDLDGALLQIRSEAIRHIDEALMRLDDGHYGVCIDCGADIGRVRLRALPFAEQCLVCAARAEARGSRVVRSDAPRLAVRPLEVDEDAA
ncbi:MAG TPA: TraR/DksA C4-type zinc finger protein [Vicinamibacterales bacterium]|nr:TraR/DksA C4-type zinc finger protein [Vicinamibacterales bacterium]